MPSACVPPPLLLELYARYKKILGVQDDLCRVAGIEIMLVAGAPENYACHRVHLPDIQVYLDMAPKKFISQVQTKEKLVVGRLNTCGQPEEADFA